MFVENFKDLCNMSNLFKWGQCHSYMECVMHEFQNRDKDRDCRNTGLSGCGNGNETPVSQPVA